MRKAGDYRRLLFLVLVWWLKGYLIEMWGNFPKNCKKIAAMRELANANWMKTAKKWRLWERIKGFKGKFAYANSLITEKVLQKNGENPHNNEKDPSGVAKRVPDRFKMQNYFTYTTMSDFFSGTGG